MKLIQRIEFATLCGVDKSAVTKAISRGVLPSRPDKMVDLDDPAVRQYLEAKKNGKRTRHSHRKTETQKEPQVSPELKEAEEFAEAEDVKSVEEIKPLRKLIQKPVKNAASKKADEEAIDNLIDEKSLYMKAKRMQAEADTRYKDTKNAQLKGTLIPREMVQRVWAKMDISLKTHLRDMPRRIAARLYALAKSSDNEKETELFLERELTDALQDILNDAAKEGLYETAENK